VTRQPIQHSLLTHYTEQSLRVGGLAGVALGLLDAALGLGLGVAEQAADVLLDAADQRVAGTLSVALGLWRTAARRQTTSSAKQLRLRLTGILHSQVAVHARHKPVGRVRRGMPGQRRAQPGRQRASPRPHPPSCAQARRVSPLSCLLSVGMQTAPALMIKPLTAPMNYTSMSATRCTADQGKPRPRLAPIC